MLMDFLDEMIEVRRGGFATFDMIFAALVVLFIVYTYLMINDALVQQTLIEQKHAAGLARTLLLSERIVKLDLAKTESPLIYANVISEVKSDAAAEYAREFNVDYLSISLTSASYSEQSTEGNPALDEKYCIRRVVLIPATQGLSQEVGALDICTG